MRWFQKELKSANDGLLDSVKKIKFRINRSTFFDLKSSLLFNVFLGIIYIFSLT